MHQIVLLDYIFVLNDTIFTYAYGLTSVPYGNQWIQTVD